MRKALLLAGGSWRLLSRESRMAALVFFAPRSDDSHRRGGMALLSRSGPRSGDREFDRKTGELGINSTDSVYIAAADSNWPRDSFIHRPVSDGMG